MEPILLVALLLGAAIGIVVATYLPYLRKIAQQKIKNFERNYLYTALVAFFTALVTAYISLPDLIATWEDSLFSGAGPFGAFLFGIIWTFGINRAINTLFLDGSKA